MLYYLKKYPFSLLIIATVIYLSFFRPPTVEKPMFFNWDKLAHFCMYGGVSGVLWLEFLWNHRRETVSRKRGLIGATLCPILFSGIIELLQEYVTSHRGGEWGDFIANTTGVMVATLIAWYLIRPWMIKRFAEK